MKYILIILIWSISLFAEEVVNGNIETNTIWTKENSPYYIYNDLTISKDATLNIKEGTEIIISEGKNITVSGALLARGSFSEPIRIKPISPGRNWGGLLFISDKYSELTFCEIGNGGKSTLSRNSLIFANNGNLKIEYSKLLNSFDNGITTQGTVLLDLGAGELSSNGLNIFEGFSKQKPAITNRGSLAISAANNCWNNENPDEIIFSSEDNSNLSEVLYNPIANDCTPVLPNVPNLISPINDSKDQPRQLYLKWHPVKDADKYEVTFSQDSNFIQNEFMETLSSQIAIYDLEFGTKYYWKVRSHNIVGSSTWSNTYSFSVYDTSKPEKVIFENYDIVNTCNDIISWQGSENTNFYKVRIFDDNGNSYLFLDSLYENSFPANMLEENSVFTISIAGHNRNGLGEWAETEVRTSGLIANRTELDIKHELLGTYYDYLILMSENLIILKNNSQEISYTKPTNHNFNKVIFRDFDLDNIPEILAYSNESNEKISLYKLVAGNLEHYQTFADNKKVNAVSVVDIDNDGDNDVIVSADGNYIFINENGLLIESEIELKNKYINFIKFDADNDTDVDFIALTDEGDLVRIINNNSKFSESSLLSGKEIKSVSAFYINKNSGIDFYLEKETGNYIYLDFEKEISLGNKNILNVVDLNNDFKSEVLAVSDKGLSIYNLVENELIEIEKISENNEFNGILFIDYNSDNLFDILATGNESKVFENASCGDIEIYVPENLRYSFTENGVLLEWDKLENAVNYNIEVYNEENDYVLSSEIVDKKQISIFQNRFISNNYYEIKSLPSGRYFWRVSATSFDGMNSDWSDEGIFVTKDFLQMPPDNWNFNKKTGSNTTFLIRNNTEYPVLDRKPERGDALGAFYYRGNELVCGGYALLDGTTNTALTLWGDNPQTAEIKDGFHANEDYRWLFWDALKGEEIPVAVSINPGSNYYKQDTINVINSVNNLNSFTAHLVPNKWIMVSTPIIPWNADSEELLNEDIEVIDYEKSFVWQNNFSYELYSNKPDSVIFVGDEIDINDYYLLLKEGFNSFPYPFRKSMKIENFFKDRVDQLIIKDSYGRLYSKILGIKEFEYLTPGRGYKVFSPITNLFTYIEKDSLEDYSFNEPDLSATGREMNILFKNISPTIKKIDFLDSEGNLLYTSSVINKNNIVPGDNIATPEKDGFYENERIIIRKVEENKSAELNVSSFKNILSGVSVSSELKFKDDAIIEIDLNQTPSSTECKLFEFKSYPIPAKDIVFVEGIELCDKLDIELINLNGEKLKNYDYKYQNGIFEIDVSKILAGNYFLKVNSCNLTTDIKILVD